MTRNAYYVAEPDHSFGAIAFASCVAEARDRGSWDSDAVKDLIVERRPQYDRYADLGYVPRLQMINDGWYWPCANCDMELSLANIKQEHPVEHHHLLYCCPQCRAEHLADREASARRRRQVVACLRSRWPGLTNIYIDSDRNPITASFRFPGGLSDVRWRSDDPNAVSVCFHDAIAWFQRYGGDIGSEINLVLS